jgi:hypothetical protein
MADFNYAFVGYENRATAETSTISATNVAAGFSEQSLANWQAFDYTQFNSGESSIVIDCGAPVDIGYFALAGHTLFSSQASPISLEFSSDPSFSAGQTVLSVLLFIAGQQLYEGITTTGDFPAQVISGNPATVFKINAGAEYRYVRLSFSSPVPCKIGVIAFGERMQFQRGFYTGFTPPSLNEQVDVSNNRSETGQYLGRSIVRSGAASGSIDLERVTRDWIDAVWTPFRQHADLYPFFLRWGNNAVVDATLAHQQSWSPSRTIRRIGTTEFYAVGVKYEGVI